MSVLLGVLSLLLAQPDHPCDRHEDEQIRLACHQAGIGAEPVNNLAASGERLVESPDLLVSIEHWPESERQRLIAANIALIEATVRHEQALQEIDQAVLRRQGAQSWIIFFTVTTVTLGGVAMAGYQLTASVRLLSNATSKSASQDTTQDPSSGLSGTTEFSWGDATFRSASIGVSVLVISLAFFFLMLDRVYSISNVADYPPDSSTAID